jgi:hypothetical protein
VQYETVAQVGLLIRCPLPYVAEHNTDPIIAQLVYGSAVTCTANAQHDPAAHNAEVERLYQVGKFAAATENR